MPYKCYPMKQGQKFQLRNEDTGKVHGTHPTLQKCMSQMKAIYANLPEKEKEAMAIKERMANDD